MRKALGYDTENGEVLLQDSITETKVPARVFGYSALALFVLGIVGMGVEILNGEDRLILVYFALSFFLAPALIVFPFFDTT